ncbi:MAG: hypothetical protein ACE5JU_23345 [Candidatus Binatia bacterium]
MYDVTLGALVQRLERVERYHRRLKWMGLTAFGGITVLLLTGQTIGPKVPKVVQAEKFILKDAAGRSRGEFAVVDGASMLSLTDEDGKGGAALTVIPDGARRLELWYAQGPSIVLAVQTDGNTGVRISHKNLMPRAALEVNPEGLPALRLAGKDSKIRAELFVHSDYSPALSLYHYDKGPIFVAGLGIANDGSVMLGLNDREEQSHVKLGIPRGGLPYLRFVDKDGKILWHAPQRK